MPELLKLTVVFDTVSTAKIIQLTKRLGYPKDLDTIGKALGLLDVLDQVKDSEGCITVVNCGVTQKLKL